MSVALIADAGGQGISLTEKPHHTTTASIIVDAPPAQVYAAATDYARWPQLLHDIQWVKVEGGGPRDATVRFRSTTLEHEIAVKFESALTLVSANASSAVVSPSPIVAVCAVSSDC